MMGLLSWELGRASRPRSGVGRQRASLGRGFPAAQSELSAIAGGGFRWSRGGEQLVLLQGGASRCPMAPSLSRVPSKETQGLQHASQGRLQAVREGEDALLRKVEARGVNRGRGSDGSPSLLVVWHQNAPAEGGERTLVITAPTLAVLCPMASPPLSWSGVPTRPRAVVVSVEPLALLIGVEMPWSVCAGGVLKL